MARIPLTRRFRTIRSTMAETGLAFAAARERRAGAFRRSAKGRAILAREAKRREQARERRERGKRTIAGLHTRYAVRGLPEPSFARDYGPETPYAVVLKLTWQIIITNESTGQSRTERWNTFITLPFQHKPTYDEIEKEIDEIWKAQEQDRILNDYPGDSGPNVSDAELEKIEIEHYFVSLRRVA